jgi:transcriptional regulator with XRE-family HTH domain
MKHDFTPPEAPKEFAKLLASKVKVSPGYASDLARGQRVPSLSKAIEFEKAYGIPCDFWPRHAGRVAQ